MERRPDEEPIPQAHPALNAATWGLIALGLVLRLARVPLRWHEANWDYAAYHQPLADALGAADLGALTRFVGLHPPLHALALTAVDSLAPSPLSHMVLSALLSALAVAVSAAAATAWSGQRAGLATAAFMVAGPVPLAYAAEVLTYPLLSCLLAGLLWSVARLETGKGGWAPAIALAVAAGMSHVLGAAAGLAALANTRRAPKQRLLALGLVALCLSPLALSALEAAQGAGTQPWRPLPVRAELFWQAFGPWICVSLAMALLALPGLRAAPWRAPAGTLLGLSLALGASIYWALAAGHQFQYLVAFTPAVAVLVGLGLATATWPRRLVYLGALALTAAACVSSARGAQALVRAHDHTSVVKTALLSADPGDALWLISPGVPDDDKRLVSQGLWRLEPRWHMPSARPFPSDFADHRYGQPRLVDGVSVYVFHKGFSTQMAEIVAHHTGQGARIWLAFYDLQGEPALEERVLRAVAPAALELEVRLGTPAIERAPLELPPDQALWTLPPLGGAHAP